MTAPQRPGVYHRWLGRHAPAMRRAVAVLVVGVVVGAAVAIFANAPWELAVIVGWDAAAATFNVNVWRLISRSDAADTQRYATREDETRTAGTVLLVAVCMASLLGVGFALGLANARTGDLRVLLIVLAALTVALSWTMLNLIYTLRYAHLYYGPASGGIAFGDTDAAAAPSYRDFAYVAFTIGMTYQVSDTAVRNTRTRRTVLAHAALAYVFGVVIIAGAINLTAGLFR